MNTDTIQTLIRTGFSGLMAAMCVALAGMAVLAAVHDGALVGQAFGAFVQIAQEALAAIAGLGLVHGVMITRQPAQPTAPQAGALDAPAAGE